MQRIDPEFIERYQKIYDENPRSQVFAILAEGYRKMGLFDQALKIAKSGLTYHPRMSSGYLVLGRVYLDRDDLNKAVIPLQEVVKLAPENILAHQLLAEAYLKLKKPKEALSAYKMVMLVSPNDPIAASAIKKLESLTADEYGADLFALVHEYEPKPMDPVQKESPSLVRTLDRILSLADALSVRSDIEKAINVLEEGRRELGAHPEIVKRLNLLSSLNEESPKELKPPKRHAIANDSKHELLSKLLKQVQSRRRELEG